MMWFAQANLALRVEHPTACHLDHALLLLLPLQEKRMFNPDRHPVGLHINLPKDLLAKVPKPE